MNVISKEVYGANIMLSKLAKESLRKEFFEKRKSLSRERREQAAQFAFSILKQWIEDFSPSKKAKVLSFAPFGDELDIWIFNRWLLKDKILLLPRVEKNSLHLYQVHSIQDLEISHLGILEPIKQKSNLLKPEEIDVAIVPGLAFDNQMHRLGYGKGFYDQFLTHLPPTIPKIGVGFKEQLSTEPLPIHGKDIALTHRFLF